MSSNVHIVMKNNKGTCVLMYAVMNTGCVFICVYVCCFAWDSSNSSGEGSKSSSK